MRSGGIHNNGKFSVISAGTNGLTIRKGTGKWLDFINEL